MTKKATKAECEHMSRVAELGCVACYLISDLWGKPAEIHHVRKHTERRNHMRVLPLCEPGHHRTGPESRHGNPKEFKKQFGTDEDLLAIVNQELTE